MGKVDIGNFYSLVGDNRILFLQERLLNSSPLLIGCQGNIKSEFSKKVCFSRISRLKALYMFIALTNSLVVLFIAVLLQIF